MKVYDLSGIEYEKDSVDCRECVEVMGWSYASPQVEPPVYVEPTTPAEPEPTEPAVGEEPAEPTSKKAKS